MKQKITLFIFAVTFCMASTLNSQNYGMKSTGLFGEGFYSNEIETLLSNQSAFTVEFWYQIETFKANKWIFSLVDSNSNRIGILTAGSDNGTVFVRVGDGNNHGQQAYYTTNNSKYPGGSSTGHHLTATEGGWNHIALTFNSGVVKLYIDGLELIGQGITGTFPSTTGDLSGESFQVAWDTDANIDEIRITKGTALVPNPDAQTSTNFDAYFDFNGNEKPSGEADGSTSTANTGSDNTVSGFIRNLAETYEVTDNANKTLTVFSTNTWTGGTTDWNTGTNWSKSAIPTAFNNVVIPDLANDPIINATTGAVVHDITTNNVLTINSGGSLIATGTVTGNAIYQVTSNDTNWHLLSSPLVGATYNGTWITDNDIDNTTRTVGTNVAIGTYTNTLDADGDWNYATDAANSGTFGTAQGYSFKKDATTNAYISFTGTLKTNNLTSSIDQSANNWNLKGNPYSSYILVSDIITDNAANLTDTHEMVYVFDNNKAGGAGYKALIGTDYIHPGQGFFVNADNSTANNFTIDATKLSHQTGKTLYKNAGIPSINLMITSEATTRSTEINYVVNKTAGLDPSFDVGIFTGEAANFNVYTQLVANNEGVDFMRQALPNSNYEDMIIPVGIKSETGKEITFSTEALNLPSGINVFLEDRLTNTFTRLDEANANYKITLTESLSGIGRFYLHTSKSVLSVDSALIFDNISIYKSNASTLRIVGLKQEKATVNIFNILGKQVMDSSFISNGIKDISLPKLAKGIYIVQLTTETGKLNKKIILE